MSSSFTDFFVAGIDIVAANMLTILSYISKDPSCQERIYEEVKHFSDNISFDEVASAHYTRAVFYECSRLCTPAFAVARISEEGLTLSGYQVKAGVS